VLKVSLRNVGVAARVVVGGGLVVFPTDTVYGLGCDPFNVDAVRRLLRLKGGREKALPVLAGCLGDVERVAVVSGGARRVAERFWPGALTLVLPKRGVLPAVVTSGLDSVGVRVPNHDVALKLARLCGGLLVGTSANKSRIKPVASAAEAFEQLGDDVDIVLDDGVFVLGVSSTVIDLTGEESKVLRVGSVNPEEVLKIFEESI